ncbi:MAG: phenylalanine--tRNA ligase subunit alpha [Candidatus Hadarchaeales archaeon]
MLLEKIEEKIGANEIRVLKALMRLGGRRSVYQVADSAGIDQSATMRASLLLSENGLIRIFERKEYRATLTHEGLRYAQTGLPERRMLSAIESGGSEINCAASNAGLNEKEKSVAAIWLRKKGLAEFEKKNDKVFIRITPAGRSNIGRVWIEENIIQEMLNGPIRCDEADAERLQALKELERRGIARLDEKTVREIELTEDGRRLAEKGLEEVEEVTELTHEMLITGKWREARLKRYDVTLPGVPVYPAKKHPQQKVIDELRDLLVRLGFKEIQGRTVESEFWNFDVLFQAQDHPAREIHDSLSLSAPEITKIPRSLLLKVASAHERGVDGSTGWGYRFDPRISARPVLCSQTTAATIRYLAYNPDPPAKVFCIHRVYRREKIDYKHLAEFYQAEGIVMEEGLSFRDMLGYLKLILNTLGFQRVRFRPGMFPFTEPSVEADVYHPVRKEWIEILGAGLFRPEVTRPLGVRHPVLAWGIGLTRLIAIRLGVDDIRKLFSGDLRWIRGEED